MEQIKDVIALVKDLLPNPWVQASIWILIGVIIAKSLMFLLGKIHWLGASKTSNQFDDLILKKIATPVFWSVLFVSIYIATENLPFEDQWKDILFSIEISIAIVLWMGFALTALRYLLKASANSPRGPAFIQKRTLPLFDNLLIITSYVTSLYFILVAWGISVGPVIASAGILGLAMSLAAKDTMANLFAGVFIMADAPYKIGDYIVLDGNERGQVTHIGIRSTRILTRDDVEITIPNSIMGNSKVINESAGPHEKYRIRIKIGLAYGSNIPLIRETLMKVATSNKDICADPEPRVRFREFGDSALLFELLCWVPNPELRGRISDQLNEQVYNAMNENNLEIPFPQRVVTLIQ